MSANGALLGLAGVPLTDMQATIGSIISRVTWVTLAGLLALSIVVALVIRVSLRPLREVGETARRVSSIPLAEGDVQIVDRVPVRVTASNTEVGQVGQALNALLDHFDSALSVRQRNEERMRRFVADASHEFRTPLASIRGYAELSLRDPTLADMSRLSLDRIHSQAIYMTDLIENMLLLARLDEGEDLDLEAVDLNRIVVESVENVRVVSPDHNWVLSLTEAPVVVHGDETRLRQVVLNLLTNARAHTPAGTTVTVNVVATGDDAELTVHDDGPGIAPSVRDELFQRFSRADSSRARATGGTGLGLAITKAIVLSHGGRVDVRSTSGDTAFTVHLPISQQIE